MGWKDKNWKNSSWKEDSQDWKKDRDSDARSDWKKDKDGDDWKSKSWKDKDWQDGKDDSRDWKKSSWNDNSWGSQVPIGMPSQPDAPPPSHLLQDTASGMPQVTPVAGIGMSSQDIQRTVRDAILNGMQDAEG